MRNGKTTHTTRLTAAIHRGHRGFTIVELLIVIAVIIMLLSILVVALNAAVKSSQKASTRVLLTSMTQGLVRFKQDVGYYPPALDNVRRLRELETRDFDAIQQWFSITSLAEYLIGYGVGENDGYGYTNIPNEPDESPPLGIRHPGRHGVWGAFPPPDHTLGDRDPPLRGEVFGPYIELTDTRLLGSISGLAGDGGDGDGDGTVNFPGDPAYNPNDPKVIADYWGNAIRYYRLPYPPAALADTYRPMNIDEPPMTLADVVLLRPSRVAPGTETHVDVDYADADGDTTATFALKTAEFALFSPGPDRAFDQMRSNDDELGSFNEDNIVEIGP